MSRSCQGCCLVNSYDIRKQQDRGLGPADAHKRATVLSGRPFSPIPCGDSAGWGKSGEAGHHGETRPGVENL